MMSGRYDDDHWKSVRSAARSLSFTNTLFRLAFMAGRGAVNFSESLETKRRIDAGAISGKLENARLGNANDLERLGMFEPGGFRLGYFDGRPVNLKTDWHIAIIGMAGFGKTTSLSLPNILHLLRGDAATGDRRESVVVLDWKDGELARASADAVHQATGEEPIVLAPFGGGSHSLNPFQDIIDAAAAGKPVIDEARARINSFFAAKIAKAGQNAWIDKDALSIAHLVVVARAYLDPEALTPGDLWDFAQASFEDVSAFMAVASEQEDVAGGFVAAGASGFLNRYNEDNIREFRWIMQSMSESFSIFARGSRLRDASQKSTFDVASLRSHPRAIYISIPDRYLITAAPYVSALLDFIVETTAQARGQHRVSILAEEFSALPFNPNVLKWVRTYRSLGIRLISVVQDRSGFSQFKEHGGHRPFEENAVKLYFGISDSEHLQHLERRGGRRSVLLETRSVAPGLAFSSGSRGGQEQLTPVLPTSHVAQIGIGQAILDIPGEPLFVLDRKPWWEQDDVAACLRDTRFDK